MESSAPTNSADPAESSHDESGRHSRQQPFLLGLRPRGLLSFAPDTEMINLGPLNVLIGPNGSGKSNLIETVELLRATPNDLAGAVRQGGGIREWSWKGRDASEHARIDVAVSGRRDSRELIYGIAMAAVGQRMEIAEELAADAPNRDFPEGAWYYANQDGQVRISVFGPESLIAISGGRSDRVLEPGSLVPDQSILSQRRDPELYPELTWLGRQFGRIQTLRDWCFGRHATVRQPQPADLPADILLPDCRNLGLVLNALEYSDRFEEYNRRLTQFLPRYSRFSTRISGGSVQLYLHEQGLGGALPATRISDGTLRFMAILAVLLMDTPCPLICIEEPELGLHPDAVDSLAPLFEEVSARTQLIVTTHSDSLVSALSDRVDSVLVCENLNGTRIQRLDADRLKYWLEDYRLGEIWRMGELGGNP